MRTFGCYKENKMGQAYFKFSIRNREQRFSVSSMKLNLITTEEIAISGSSSCYERQRLRFSVALKAYVALRNSFHLTKFQIVDWKS